MNIHGLNKHIFLSLTIAVVEKILWKIYDIVASVTDDDASIQPLNRANALARVLQKSATYPLNTV